MFDICSAENFISANARPFEKAAYECLYLGSSPESAVNELRLFQNSDGGFGNALEADSFNPSSTPITTNDALIWLYRMGFPDPAQDITDGILRYLRSHDSFDENERRWLFAVESNKDYPHAIWWEKNGSGIRGFNPTVSLAAFMCCSDNDPLYKDIISEAASYLESSESVSGDEIKCFLLAYKLLETHGITDIIDLASIKELLIKRTAEIICPDTSKYGVEYVTAPSDIFSGIYTDFIAEDIKPLIRAEADMLGNIQKDDGGFDISWQWYTPYPEFKTARNIWRPRVTLEKLLFAKTFAE